MAALKNKFVGDSLFGLLYFGAEMIWVYKSIKRIDIPLFL